MRYLPAMSCQALDTPMAQKRARASTYFHRPEQFELKYLEFDIPFHRLCMHNNAPVAIQSVGDKDLCLSFEAQTSTAWVNWPAETVIPSLHYRAKDHLGWPPLVFAELLEWIKLDYEKGSLSAFDVARLILVQTDSSHQNLHHEIRGGSVKGTCQQDVWRWYSSRWCPVGAVSRKVRKMALEFP